MMIIPGSDILSFKGSIRNTPKIKSHFNVV